MSVKTINQIKGLITTLKKDEENLYKQLKEVRSNQTFKCLCGKYHKIRDTDSIVEVGWSQGYGYEDGYSYDKNFYAICPTKGFCNRFLYPSYWLTPYEKQTKYKFNAEKQFENIYRDLFKSCVKVDSKDFNYEWGNNNYIDENHKKFGINISGGIK